MGQMRQQLDSQFKELAAKYPYARRPEVRQRLEERIAAWNPEDLTGIVEQAFWAEYGNKLATGQYGNVQQSGSAGASTQAPPSVPSGLSGEREEPETTDLDEIAERQKRNPHILELLGISRKT